MTFEHPSRRNVLKTTVALSTAASLGVATGRAEDRSATPLGRLDAMLRGATEARDAPGLVAVAATDKDILYEGVFGSRDLATGETMTGDTVFRIASMTKAITSTAAMQLVEQGKLKLEDPVPNIDPVLGTPQVLEGFDASGAPKLRPAKLIFDPGERWEYGVNTDWVGRIVESVSGKPLDAYFRDHIFGPLGMKDTDYVFSPQQQARLVSVHQRKPDGSLEPQPQTPPFTPEFRSGGGGLYSTASDYLTFTRMLLQGGSFNGTRILKPETMALINRNQIGDIEAGRLKTTTPARSTDVDFFPGQSLKWGLGYMINPQQGPNGRSAGTVTWAGIFNTHYWIDPARRVTGVIMMQVLPFGDPRAMKVYGQFERGVYDLLKSA
jgi:methyl acetate hydrolase